MKTLLLLSFLLCCVLQLSAQAPKQFSFQGVARDAAGKAITNTAVSLRLTIREGSPGGASLYQELHKPQTSNSGIFTVSVGAGNDLQGTLGSIKWSVGSYFLQVEMDAAGGNNYLDLGATQLLSVPFALHAEQADKWKDGDPVVQRGIEGQGQILPNRVIGFDAHLIWYPRKSAFRAGYSTGSWDDVNIGLTSAAFGTNTTASGQNTFAAGSDAVASGEMSTAIGSETKAEGDASFAIGDGTTAKGTLSFAGGYLSNAFGNHSMAFGHSVTAIGGSSFATGSGTLAKAHSSVSLGTYNDIQDNPNSNDQNELDRIMQIGNGKPGAHANVMTVLRNGKIGIGNNVLEPSHILDIGGRPRIRNNGGNNTAGLYFDDSNHSPEGFVGMKSNSEIGFYNAKKWLFWVDDQGNAHVLNGTLQTSDRRLKRNFTSLSSSLSKLTDLNGYHYFWKDSTLDQTLQTGLIAQEVETHFPELVKTDDKGFKSVNYTGLIPHLIESVKELKASVEYLQNLNTSIKAQNEALKAQAGEIEGIRKEINALLDAAKSNSGTAPINASTKNLKSESTEK